ncbi:SDR family NAD(P)-dependent oxidoreductase [Cellulomonas sp. S1-8]|uniref:SDR family NAD(P)-dependent oxidoreductase n=1 Tax=Cellulomonas sp. S1-8 TaxID=2904790 RepID=UPI002244E478|nr:SDR family NAD(P)-dependent oxidoreductase [Cellulomonas sp. S1-8]UZN03319.1 SDR family NAD(P)-dependent oxidoreductase [Cellulomonas sp. S1-8]
MSADVAPVDLTDRVALVTGATGGMGRVIAVELARRGATVVTVARDARRAADVAEEVARVAGPGRFRVVEGDLTRRADVVAAAERIAAEHPVLHLLVNNAGAHFAQHALSVDGVERHVALHHLAAFGLSALLTEPLVRGGGRVVGVASDSLNDTRQIKLGGRARPAALDPSQLDDVRALNPAAGFVPFEAYARAKLLAVIAGYELADRLADRGVTVNAAHPGIVATDIIDDLVPRWLTPLGGLIRRTMLTPADGARAALRLATDPALAGTTGAYFDRDRRATTPPVSHDRTVRARVWAAARRHYGLADQG